MKIELIYDPVEPATTVWVNDQVITHALAFGIERHTFTSLVPCDLWLRRERLLASDKVGRLLANHHRRGIDIAVGHRRKDASIGNIESFSTPDLHGLGVDDGHRIILSTHLRRARRMQCGLAIVAYPFEDLLV